MLHAMVARALSRGLAFLRDFFVSFVLCSVCAVSVVMVSVSDL